MSVHVLPVAAPAIAPRHIPRAAVDNPHVYTFGQVAWMLGVKLKSAGYQVSYVVALMETQGFPAPLAGYIRRQGKLLTGADAVRHGAHWMRAAVDAWFEGQLPPGARDILAEVRATADEAALDANAENLDALVARRVRA